MGWASGTQTYEAPGNLHIRDVVVNCPKLTLGQLVQIQVMGSASNKILSRLYICICICMYVCIMFVYILRRISSIGLTRI